MLVVPSTKWQLLFCDNQGRGTTGDMVQRHLFRYYSMHIAGNAGESAKSIGYAPLLRRRCSSLQATRFLFFTALFPRFAGWWALFLFSDTAVDSIPHFLILRFSPGRISQLLPLPSDRSFSGCLLPLTVLFNFFVRLFFIWQKKGGLMAANDVKELSNGNVFVVDKNCGSIIAIN
ncbi:hypothetical protein HTY54_28895 [Escherichia coli]|nr:hypothetical protein [Escherichia coli]